MYYVTHTTAQADQSLSLHVTYYSAVGGPSTYSTQNNQSRNSRNSEEYFFYFLENLMLLIVFIISSLIYNSMEVVIKHTRM